MDPVTPFRASTILLAATVAAPALAEPGPPPAVRIAIECLAGADGFGGVGSGFFVSPDLLVTADHVLGCPLLPAPDPAAIDRLYVDGVAVAFEIVRRFPSRDLAILRVAASPSASVLRVAERGTLDCSGAGFPRMGRASDGGPAPVGTVAGTCLELGLAPQRRELVHCRTDGATKTCDLTPASAPPLLTGGASGGPVLTTHGEAMGVLTAIASAPGLGPVHLYSPLWPSDLPAK